MSADNYHYVGETSEGRVGIWRNLSASMTFTHERVHPDETYDTVEEALVRAHKLLDAEPTEYGVRVEEGLL